jgi:glycosyltransferase involved in cell wall biosynthesis
VLQQFSSFAADSIELSERPRYNYEGRRCRGVAVQMYGMFHDCSSIPNVCGQIARALRAVVPSLALQSYTGGPFFDRDLEPLAGVDRDAPIGFFYGIPDAVEGPVTGHATRIIGLACETDRIPLSWVECCNGFDLAVVPSRYCEKSLRDSGVEVPILVVPHGLESCYRPRREKRRTSPFVFYNVVNGQFPARKGLPELARAFRRAFGGRADVVLRLRVNRGFKVRQAFADAGVAEDDPQIHIDEQTRLPTEEFAAYYSDVHCTVHPSHSEGFGLIPFQSIACETPVIAPCSTGMADYLTADNAMLLRTNGVCTAPDVYYRAGSHPGVDEDHLVELLRYAEGNWEAEYERVRRVASGFRECHSWPLALRELLPLIRDLVALPDPADRRALIRARVS